MWGTMWNSFLTVGQQVLILFLLVLVGYLLGKTKIITDKGGKVCSDLALLIATPCVIIKSFQREYNTALMYELLIALAVAFGLHVVAIVIAHIVYRKDTPTTRVYRTSTVLSNAGFMGLPLQQAVLGDQGVMYGATYVVAMSVTMWSYGLLIMDKSGGKVPIRKMLFSPGVIGLVVGFLLFACRVTLPEIIFAPIRHLGNLNTPLPMLFAGYYLSKVDMKQALKKPADFGAMAMRLLVVPVISIALMYVCGIRGNMLLSMAIASTAPVAVAVAMFADRYRQDAETSINLVALSTLFSVVTMPVILAAVQVIA